jgi:hypothetical protein
MRKGCTSLFLVMLLIVPAAADNAVPVPLAGGKILGAGRRAERNNELKQIGLSFIQFCDEYKGASRTKENFLNYIRTFGPIHEAVKSGYYQMNMKAKLTSNDIIAHEQEMDGKGYLSVKGDGSVHLVPEAEWKAALGIK